MNEQRQLSEVEHEIAKVFKKKYGLNWRFAAHLAKDAVMVLEIERLKLESTEEERPMETLTLKWGTVKGWDGFTEKSQEIIKRYFAEGVPMSAMVDHPDDDRQKILCELIDQLDGEIWNDWDGKVMSKDEAKQYVLNYGKKH